MGWGRKRGRAEGKAGGRGSVGRSPGHLPSCPVLSGLSRVGAWCLCARCRQGVTWVLIAPVEAPLAHLRKPRAPVHPGPLPLGLLRKALPHPCQQPMVFSVSCRGSWGKALHRPRPKPANSEHSLNSATAPARAPWVGDGADSPGQNGGDPAPLQLPRREQTVAHRPADAALLGSYQWCLQLPS